MAKILIGLLAAIVIAAGGFFGFQFYTQHRIAGQVDAAFEQMRATGAKASHGKVSFDLLNRTVTIADIASESGAQPPVSVKIASVTATGVSQPDATRFSADSIDVADIEIAAAMAAPAGFKLDYKVPRITVKDYSGPVSLPHAPASSSLIDVYRFALERFSGIAASSVTAPSLAATITFGGATPGGIDVAYSGLAMQGIKDGKIATSKVDGVVFNVNLQQAGKINKVTGNLANLASYDVDLGAVAAILDPQKANDDRYYRAYRQASAGPYVITSALGLNMRIDGFTINDVAFKPSRMQIPALLAMLPAAGATPPTPAQAREMIEKAANLYEGMHIGNAEMHGLSVDTPQGPFKLQAMRINLDGGKIGEFALEGLDTRAPAGPVKVARFALKSLDIANLLRMSALFSNPAQKPPPEQLLGLLAMLEGAEVKGLTAPYKNTPKPVNIDTLSLDWGQFIGPIPTRAHLIAKLSGPIEASDAGLRPLLDAGMNTLAIDLDAGAAWTEASRSFALDPATIDVGGLLKAQARVALANVPRGVFSPNLPQATAMAGQIEAGTLELVVQDLGVVDLAVGQYAKTQNVSLEAARAAIADKIRASVADPTTDPNAMTIAQAAARFVENPRGTLTLKLTPNGKLQAIPLLQALKTDPLVVLAQFQVEVANGR